MSYYYNLIIVTIFNVFPIIATEAQVRDICPPYRQVNVTYTNCTVSGHWNHTWSRTDCTGWRGVEGGWGGGGGGGGGLRGVGRQALTFVHVVIGHDGHTLLPDHAHVGAVAVARPQEHGQQDGLGDGAPQHTQHHPVVGAVVLQAGEAHHLMPHTHKFNMDVLIWPINESQQSKMDGV